MSIEYRHGVEPMLPIIIATTVIIFGRTRSTARSIGEFAITFLTYQ